MFTSGTNEHVKGSTDGSVLQDERVRRAFGDRVALDANELDSRKVEDLKVGKGEDG